MEAWDPGFFGHFGSLWFGVKLTTGRLSPNFQWGKISSPIFRCQPLVSGGPVTSVFSKKAAVSNWRFCSNCLDLFKVINNHQSTIWKNMCLLFPSIEQATPSEEWQIHLGKVTFWIQKWTWMERWCVSSWENNSENFQVGDATCLFDGSEIRWSSGM